MRGWKYAAALACCAALVSPAQAAPSRPECPLITDPAGDVDAVAGPAGDLLAVDAGTAGRTFTATVSLVEVDGSTPFVGHQYDVEVAGVGRRVTLAATLDSGQSHFEMHVEGGTAFSTGEIVAEIAGSVDRKRRQVTMSVDLLTLGFPVGRGVVISASSHRSASTLNNKGLTETSVTTGADQTRSEPHRLGARRCRL